MGTHPIFESDFDCLTEQIMSDEDDDWEDVAEELYAIEIQGYSNSADETVPINKAEKVKVIGMETPNPIMQIDGFIFKGAYSSTSGTTAFLNGDDESAERGQLDALTEKKLTFTRCLLSKKQESSDFFTGNDDGAVAAEEEEEDTFTSDEDEAPDLLDELRETIFISSDSD